jgi:hypothetical protein
LEVRDGHRGASASGATAATLRGRGGAFGLDAFQEGAGGFVVRVLGDELAAEGLGEDGWSSPVLVESRALKHAA